MKLTLSIIKADIGSIGGHVAPSKKLESCVADSIRKQGANLLLDYSIAHTGDDIAIVMTHTKGTGNAEVHRLAWDAFRTGADEARAEGLYGAGLDLLVDSYSGNVKGMGPAVAEMEIEERPNEPFLVFAADKTDPGAYNLPLYLAFADPMNTPGLILSPKMGKGFRFVIMDVNHTEGDRLIELNAPENLYDIATLLRDPERFVVESVWSRSNGEQAAAVSTTPTSPSPPMPTRRTNWRPCASASRKPVCCSLSTAPVVWSPMVIRCSAVGTTFTTARSPCSTCSLNTASAPRWTSWCS